MINKVFLLFIHVTIHAIMMLLNDILLLKLHLELCQILFIQATILSIWFPCLFCQNTSQYATCIEPFQCGRLKNLSYPFWGGSRPPYCGYPGFELNCDGDVPLLNISSLSYRVLEINFSTYTLRVAREDIWNNTCPEVLQNTTIDTDYFEIPQNSSDSDITLYYGCANNQGRQIRVRNQFNCDVDGVTTVNVFDAGDPLPGGPGNNITCNRTIAVPVNRTAAQALETPTASSVNVLKSALASGFSVQWSADNANCESCQRSGGTCVYNPDSAMAVLPGMHPAPSPTSIYNRSYIVPPPASAPSASPESSGRVGILVGAIVGTTCVITITTVIVCYIKRRRLPGRPNEVSNKGIEDFLHHHGSLAPKRYKYSEIKKITKSFNDKLGEGGYGSVYKGALPDGSLVAVKVLTEINSNGEEFINEVATISRTSHVNIVSLLGFCYDGNKRALVYEFMPNMSLDKFICNSGLSEVNCRLDLNKLYDIVVGVAKGLEYLHTGCSSRIVHFDIKPQNILLDEDLCPKISDFGLAKLCKKKQSALSVVGTRGTIGYIAPEVFSRNFGRVTHKSDVYSYGMMVLEMVGANKTVESEETQSSENYFPDKIYELVTRDVNRNVDDLMVEGEQETMRKMILVGFWCMQTCPSERPSMSKVVEMLEGSIESIQIPPKPVLITPTLPEIEYSASFSAYTDTENSAEVIVDG